MESNVEIRGRPLNCSGAMTYSALEEPRGLWSRVSESCAGGSLDSRLTT